MRKSTKTSFGQYPDSVFKKQMSASWVRSRDSEDLHPQMVKQARSSGQLNLSGRGLVSVPDKVSLSFVQTDHVTWTPASHWSTLVTWPEHWLLWSTIVTWPEQHSRRFDFMRLTRMTEATIIVHSDSVHPTCLETICVHSDVSQIWVVGSHLWESLVEKWTTFQYLSRCRN